MRLTDAQRLTLNRACSSKPGIRVVQGRGMVQAAKVLEKRGFVTITAKQYGKDVVRYVQATDAGRLLHDALRAKQASSPTASMQRAKAAVQNAIDVAKAAGALAAVDELVLALEHLRKANGEEGVSTDGDRARRDHQDAMDFITNRQY